MLHKGRFDFYLDKRSKVPAYAQLVNQVKGELRLGHLRPGDQLPTVMEIVDRHVISPNTVLKAYRQLELEGLVVSRPAVGTFIAKTLGPPDIHVPARLQRGLERWLRNAREAGLDEDAIDALIDSARRQLHSSKAGVA